MTSNLCNVAFNWNFDKSPSLVTKYTYFDVTDSLTQNGFLQPRLNDDTELIPKTPLLLTKSGNDETNSHCALQIVCPTPKFAQINGFFVLSESRTIEVSNEEKGYLTTVRGRKVDNLLESSQNNYDGSNTCSSMYLCSCYFDDNYPNLSLKFLSLSGRTSFCVKTVAINIVQHGIHSASDKSSLNVSKLKKDIEDMGNIMSDRAKDFMATLEQYDKNKMSMSKGFLNPGLSNSGPCVSPNGLSSIMSTILGAGNMQALAGSGGSSDCDKSDIYNILNSVCGTISSRRIASFMQTKDETEEDRSPTTSQSLETDSGHATSQDLEIVISLVVEKMEKLKSDMRDELSEMKQEMLSEIDNVKCEMNQKLDLILNFLQTSTLTQDGM